MRAIDDNIMHRETAMRAIALGDNPFKRRSLSCLNLRMHFLSSALDQAKYSTWVATHSASSFVDMDIGLGQY